MSQPNTSGGSEAATSGGANVADQAIAFARAQIGKPYVFGATGPDSYDCSGLIMQAYAHANPPVKLTHFTGTMLGEGTPVKKEELAPGDLVFPDPGHVQLYSGGGKIIEAPTEGENVQERAMWGFWQARRVTTPGSGAAGGGGDSSSGGGVLGQLKSIGDVVDFLLDVNTWVRYGIFLVGIILCLIGAGKIIHSFGQAQSQVLNNVKKTVKSTAKGLGGASSSQSKDRQTSPTPQSQSANP